ncbi:fasciclin domain-containing protein [Natronomonas gomsonensis]|uniref:fasciclin domain-containing protein n=1 Tax=Natronomonas gomsonensis TaxID=1046043 RepID=UPI0015BE158D|nr:fasciclin domain-containing protein [Natronomonas gomsonensis]
MNQTRRAVLKTIGGSTALAVGVGTVSARGRPESAKGRRTGASGDDTIVDIAVESEDFTVLVAAVEEAGLVDALSGNKQLTVFAPTDQAFEDLAGALGVELEDLLELENLADILLYHVTNGRRYSQSVVNAPRIRMLNGGTVDVDGTDLNGDQADIVDTDIEASNGVVHVIDGVLLPE